LTPDGSRFILASSRTRCKQLRHVAHFLIVCDHRQDTFMKSRSTYRSPAAVCPAVLILVATVWLSGCVEAGRMASRLDPDQRPLAVEDSAVSDCELLGALAEDIDPGCLSMTAERVRCELEVRDRARQMGATHIVWIYRLSTGVAAKAFRCPPAPAP
jgi:hypothetical protein